MQCENCSNEFEPRKRGRARWCPACKTLRRREWNELLAHERSEEKARKRSELVCQRCQQAFNGTRSDQKYCSTCRPLVQKAQASAWEKARTGAPRKVSELDCIDCGVRFTATRNDALRCVTCNYQLRLEKDRNRSGLECVECGASVTRRSSRCRSCAKKAEQLVGDRNPNWKGGRSYNNGYVMVKHNKPDKVHPYQGEHILIWEETHGPLPKGWNVHHFNGVKDDNRPDNLIGLSASDHHVFGPEVRRHYEERIRELEAQLASSVL